MTEEMLYMMTFRTKRFLLLAVTAALMSSAGAASSSDQNRRKAKRDDGGPRRRSSHNFQKSSLPSRPISLKGVPKLSERMESLSSDSYDSDFLERLRAEEDRLVHSNNNKQRSTRTSSSSASQVLFWGLTGGMVLVLATSSLGMGGSSASYAMASTYLWKELVSTSMSLYWLAWVRPGMSLGDLLTPLSGLLDGTVRVYVVDTMLPFAYKMVKRIVVTEMWNAYFRRMWKELEGLFAGNNDPIEATGNVIPESTSYPEPTRWLYEKHKIVVDIIERGTKKVIQSSLQKQFQSSFHSLSSTLIDALRQASARGMSGLLPPGGDVLSML